MPKEIELKFPVPNHDAVRKALLRLGAVCRGGVVQSDCYFDTPAGELREADCGLRIRTILKVRGRRRGEADLPQLTYKGPKESRSKAKVRPEFQTRLQDPKAMAAILAFLGFRPALTIEKRRTTYRLGRCQIELDELPLIGPFVEIEGPSEKLVTSAARRLGLTGESIKTSYTALVSDACRNAGLTITHVTFGSARKRQ